MDKRLFMEACRKGGLALETASRILDRELAVLLHRECRSVVRDEHDANDIVQETFIRTWKRCATFRGDSELLAWIRGILRHAIVDHFRAKRSDEPIEDEEGNMSDAVTEQIARLSIASRDRPDEWLSAGQREACYRRCFAAFEKAAPLHAAVMRWITEDELSNDEIAALLQRSPGATREFISQCRKKARIHFAEWYAMRREPDG